MSKGSDLVLFNTYYDLADAYIDKGVLETNGVRCVITNDLISNLYPAVLTPQSSIRLWISPQDADLAKSIIQSPALPS